MDVKIDRGAVLRGGAPVLLVDGFEITGLSEEAMGVIESAATRLLFLAEDANSRAEVSAEEADWVKAKLEESQAKVDKLESVIDGLKKRLAAAGLADD